MKDFAIAKQESKQTEAHCGIVSKPYTNCKGRLNVIDDDVTMINYHMCPADLSKNEAAESVAQLRWRAAEDLEKPCRIIQRRRDFTGGSTYQHKQHVGGQSNKKGSRVSSRNQIH